MPCYFMAILIRDKTRFFGALLYIIHCVHICTQFEVMHKNPPGWGFRCQTGVGRISIYFRLAGFVGPELGVYIRKF